MKNNNSSNKNNNNSNNNNNNDNNKTINVNDDAAKDEDNRDSVTDIGWQLSFEFSWSRIKNKGL